MRVKYCTNCGGNINVVNPKFCPECGFSFSGAIAKSENKEEEEQQVEGEARTEFARPEITIEMGKSNPITFGELVKQGESASADEVRATRRPPHEFSNMDKEEIRKQLLKECGPVQRVKEISED